MLPTALWRIGIVSTLAVCALAPPLRAQSESTAGVVAEVSLARLEILHRRLARAEAFFEPRGEADSLGATLSQSFPEYAGAPLSDPAYLELARSEIRRGFERRASLRRLSAPPGSSDDRAVEWTELVRRQCDAEDRIDALRERVLAGLTAGFRSAPGFSADAFDGQLEAYRKHREMAVEAGQPHRGLEAVELESLLVRYRAAAYRRMILGEDPALARLVAADLEMAPASETGREPDVSSEARRDRLRRAIPLLDGALAARVVDALGDAPHTPASSADGTPSETDGVAQPATDHPEGLVEQERYVALSERLVAIESEERRRRRNMARELAGIEEQVERLHSRSIAARASSRFEAGRGDRLDAAYIHARQLAGRIREAWHAHRLASQQMATQEIEARANIPAPLHGGGAADATLAWAELALDLERAFDARAVSVAQEEENILALLDSCLVERRRLASFVSRDARVALVGTIQSEFFEEVREAPVWLRRELTKLGRWFRSTRQRTGELSTLRSLFYRSLDLLVLFLGWVYVRSRATNWLSWLLESRRRRPKDSLDAFATPERLAPAEVGRFALPATDSLGWLTLHYFLLPRSLLLAFVVLIGLSRSLYRAISSLVHVLVSRSRARVDPLTGKVAITLESKALSLRTADWFLTWWILFTILGFFAWPLVKAFWWEQLILVARWSVFFFIAVYLLGRWSRPMRDYLVDHVEHNRFTVWLTRARVGRVRSILATLAGAVYLAGLAGFRLLVGVGWFRALHVSMARSQLREKDSTPIRPAVASRILSQPGPLIPRTEELARLRDHFLGWTADERRGMIAVVGDRGMGKTAFLEQAAQVLRESGECTPVFISFRPETRSASFSEVVASFGESLGIELSAQSSPATAKRDIQRGLSERERTVILVDDFHFLLRRAVGGFTLVRFFLNIMQACSYRHFWILGLHRPAWRYVQGVSESVRLGFRDEISLSGFDAKRLRDNLVARTESAGFQLDYDCLVPDRILDEERSRAAARARTTYWQLLTQSSAGNPSVAAEYWIDSLGDGNERSGIDATASDPHARSTLGVHLFNPHLVSEVESMSDEYLFVLTALVVHDGLSLPELSEVLNQSPSKTQLGCQHLESLGILRRRGEFYNVASTWQPAVLHVLDQKSFAHT